MSGKCEGIEEHRGQLGYCINSLYNVQQLLHNGHVISDSNSFDKSLDKLQGAIADLSRAIVAPCSAEDSRAGETAASTNEIACSSSDMIDLTDVSKNDDDDVDEFDSILCDMNDEEFDIVVNSQPLMSSDVTVCSEGSHEQSSIMGDMPSPCQQHVEKLKQVFGHSQFKP